MKPTMTEAVTEILFIFALVLINGLFAMTEIALISSRKARLQARAEEGDHGARAALHLMESPTRFLSTTQIGITLVGILSGAIGGATLSHQVEEFLAQAPWLAPYSQPISLALVVVVITYLSLVFGELIPKRLALTNPERIAASLSRFMEFLARLSAPVLHLLSASTDWGLRLLGVSPNSAADVTEEEVKVMIDQGTLNGVFEEVEQDMLESVFRLSDRTVETIMTPRTEMTWLDIDNPYDDLLRQVIESSFSRFPVAQGSLDNMLGILQARELLAQAVSSQTVDVRSCLRAPIFLPESTPAFSALEQLKHGGMHMALVMDEYGGVLGLVTLFDILESIVGEISAGPGETSEPQVIHREDGSLLLDGLLKVDVLKDLLDIKELPDENRAGYQTLGGLIMSQFGDIPVSGQYFEWEDLRFEVIDMDKRRVDKVLVRRMKEE
jgi:putative hemolysin